MAHIELKQVTPTGTIDEAKSILSGNVATVHFSGTRPHKAGTFTFHVYQDVTLVNEVVRFAFEQAVYDPATKAFDVTYTVSKRKFNNAMPA